MIIIIVISRVVIAMYERNFRSPPKRIIKPTVLGDKFHSLKSVKCRNYTQKRVTRREKYGTSTSSFLSSTVIFLLRCKLTSRGSEDGKMKFTVRPTYTNHLHTYHHHHPFSYSAQLFFAFPAEWTVETRSSLFITSTILQVGTHPHPPHAPHCTTTPPTFLSWNFTDFFVAPPEGRSLYRKYGLAAYTPTVPFLRRP